MGNVEIRWSKQLKKMKRPLIVIGFPGTGLVGSVAASQIVESLKMGFGGHLSSPDFAPLAAIHDYLPMPAARIHFSPKHNLIVILSEMTIPVGSSRDVADKIFELAKEVKASGIISLGGISLKDEKGQVYTVSSDREMIKTIISKKIARPIKEGATTGVTGILLTKGMLERFSVTTILAESSEEYLDPNAASAVLKTLNRIAELDIGTGSLDKEAAELSKSIKETMIKAKIAKKSGPSANEGGSMFG